MSLLYPKGYFSKVSEISLEYLQNNNIKGIILDVDNTLIDYYRNMSEETIRWVSELKKNKIKMYILSNSNNYKKVQEVAKRLNIEQYSKFGMKPLKRGFKKAQRELNLNSYEIAVIGDQIFTDVIGANRMRMHSILVDPIMEKDIFITLLKRPIEIAIKKKILRNNQPVQESVNLKQYITENVDINYTDVSYKRKIQKIQRESREEK